MSESIDKNCFYINQALDDSLNAMIKTWKITSRTWNKSTKGNSSIQLPFLSQVPGNETVAFNMIIKTMDYKDNHQKIECTIKQDMFIQNPNFKCKIIFKIWNGRDEMLNAGDPNTSISEFSGWEIDINKGYPLWELYYKTSDAISIINNNRGYIYLRFYIEFRKHITLASTSAYQLMKNFTLYNIHTDLEIICDSMTFKTNKRVLASQSEVFRQMLLQPMAEKTCSKIVIEDVSGTTINHFLKFLSSSEIDSSITSENIIELTYMADKYFINNLKKECKMKLEQFFNTGNIIDMLILSDQCQLGERFKTRILRFMKLNIVDLSTKESWKELMKSYPDKINTFILFSLEKIDYLNLEQQTTTRKQDIEESYNSSNLPNVSQQTTGDILIESITYAKKK